MSLPKSPGRTTPSFAFSYVERCLQEGIGRRRFGKLEHAQVLQFFSRFDAQPACVYCGASAPTRWDHIIPVRYSGETVLGNMVLACQACDDAKQARPFRDWMRGKGFIDCESRIIRVEQYMAEFGYVEPAPDSCLTPAELTELERLRCEAAELRRNIEGFIARVSARRFHN